MRRILPSLLFLLLTTLFVLNVAPNVQAISAPLPVGSSSESLFTSLFDSPISIFIVKECLFFALFFAALYLFGLCVTRLHWKVNYTRKASTFIIFFSSLALGDLLPSHYFPSIRLASLILFLSVFLLFLEPLRQRIPFLATCFAAINRPEDHPYTLRWITSEMVINYAVIGIISGIYANYGLWNFAYLSVFIISIGDGLAEPVGVRFGKHTYQTRALFTKKRYVRSLEGSAAVFFASVGLVYFFGSQFTSNEMLIALLVIPITATLAEAFSPHTWDGPLIHIGCTASVLAIKWPFTFTIL